MPNTSCNIIYINTKANQCQQFLFLFLNFYNRFSKKSLILSNNYAILYKYLLKVYQQSGCSAVGSARGLGPWGHRFDPCHPDQNMSETRLYKQARTSVVVPIINRIGKNIIKTLKFKN